MDLHGRAALVTGGSGSLGGAISRALAEAGCNIAIGYVGNRAGADETLEAVEKLGRTACRVQIDQTEPAAIEPAVERAARDLGRLDILINNAAWNIGIPFAERGAPRLVKAGGRPVSSGTDGGDGAARGGG